jgi:hypothetical protein
MEQWVGNPNAYRGGSKKIPLKDRLDRNIAIQPNGCWLWLGANDERGRGIIGSGLQSPKTIRVHIATMMVHKDYDRQGGKQLNHKTIDICEYQHKCCNPDHMYVGTQQENFDDMRTNQIISAERLG